jgi:hypothetical protein
MKSILIIIVSLLSLNFYGQNKADMKFPVIYFKLNSIDYADMPYTADSCLKFYIKHTYYNKEGRNGSSFEFRIYRNEDETEQLTDRRIIKLKYDMNKIKNGFGMRIIKAGAWQKTGKSDFSDNQSPLGIMLDATRIDMQSMQ